MSSPELITPGVDLLRPAWDFGGRLWEVDRRETGAIVYVLDKRTGRCCRSTSTASAART